MGDSFSGDGGISLNPSDIVNGLVTTLIENLIAKYGDRFPEPARKLLKNLGYIPATFRDELQQVLKAALTELIKDFPILQQKQIADAVIAPVLTIAVEASLYEGETPDLKTLQAEVQRISEHEWELKALERSRELDLPALLSTFLAHLNHAIAKFATMSDRAVINAVSQHIRQVDDSLSKKLGSGFSQVLAILQKIEEKLERQLGTGALTPSSATSIFISYERESEGAARDLNARLTAEGLTVWQDVKNIRHTEQWPLAINQALEDCERIIVLLTPRSMQSREVFNEWFAFYSDRKAIHCLMLETCKPHYQLRPFQWLDWRDPSRRDWQRLFDNLRGAFKYEIPDTVIVSANAPERSLEEALDALRAAAADGDRSVALSPKQISDIINHKPRTPDEQRLMCVAEWSQERYALDNRFVHLTLNLDKGHDSPDAKRETPVERSYTDLRDILNERDDTAFILLGEPGGGKSTLLRRLQLDDAVDRLRDGGTRLSLFVSLNGYKPERENDPLPSPREWLNAVWGREYPALPALDDLLRDGRMLLLLDALNEVPHASDEEYHRRVDLWQTFLASMRSDHRGNRAIITCRSRDYVNMLGTKDVPVPRIDIRRMRDEQVQDFLKVYLPGMAGTVWGKLKGTPQLDLFRTPFYLKLLIDQVEDNGDIPAGRAALFTGFVRQTLYRELEGRNANLVDDDLLDPDDRYQIINKKWTDPYELPSGGCLIPGLTDLAYGAQEQGRLSDGAQVLLRKADAHKLIDRPEAKKIVRAGIDMTVLNDLVSDVQFFHQLLQEYFAARRLAQHPDPTLVHVEWEVDRVSPALQETLDTLADSDPLPLLPQTGWEETTLVGVPVTDDQDGFIRGLMAYNLPLAARCAASPEVTLDPVLKRELQDALIARTQDYTGTDLRARIAAGLALGELSDPRFERRRGPYGDYLMPPLVDIAGGTYPIGDDDSPYADEKPAHTVELEPFSIGAFPVTNAEYALFMAAGGYRDEQWWDTDEALAWLRGEGSAEGRKQSDRDVWNNLQALSDERINDLVHENRITSQQAEWFVWFKGLDEAQLEERLADWHTEGVTYRQPEYWYDTRFNNPAQPVVGVTWFEARAYCKWLSAQTEEVYDLPGEAQFEAAARGTEGREYPYGGPFDVTRGNTFESHIRRTTPPGIFDNATPEGAYDLTGNAYTWTLSIYDQDQYPYEGGYDAGDGREDPHSSVRRVLRGGSWGLGQGLARAAARNSLNPYDRSLDVGFRVCGPPSL